MKTEEKTMQLGEIVRDLVADYSPENYMSALALWFSLIETEKNSSAVQLTDCKMLANLGEFFVKVQQALND